MNSKAKQGLYKYLDHLKNKSMSTETKKEIENNRKLWAKVAKKNGWYKSPFFVQVWLNPDGTVEDSVSFQGMTEDIIINP